MPRPNTPPAEIRPVALALQPLDVVRAWPESLPLAAMVSAATGPHRSRWSILARPQSWAQIDGPHAIVPHVDLPPHPREIPENLPPFTGGWLGYLSYELGAVLEPAAALGLPASAAPSPGALGGWARCDSAYVHDNASGQWWVVGDARHLPTADDLLTRARAQSANQLDEGRFLASLRLKSLMGQDRYQRAVARAVEYIRAGDVFQVNLAHTLAGRVWGSPRGLFRALARAARPWYGAYLETPWGVIASLSPELFLDYDARTRRVITRPMKGTRGVERGAAELLASEKDAAELNMIVDLMRNDLGRVCEFGSVRVETPREVETHGAAPAGTSRGEVGGREGTGGTGGVLQGVATVSGTVRPESGLDGLLRAAFPPGSITGAPKVRAMQIISELETTSPGGTPRGPYCGCIGFLSDSGRAEFSVAIRTAVLTPAPGTPPAPPAPTGSDAAFATDTAAWDVRYGVGAGIVADSDPAAEWLETLVKARIWSGIARVMEW